MNNNTTIQTHSQAKIRTVITNSSGNKRTAILTTKQALFTRMKSFSWVPISTLTSHVSRSGIRRALTEMRQSGYGIETKYNSKNGSIMAVRLISVPGIGSSFRTPTA